MDRKQSIKTLLMGSLSLPFLKVGRFQGAQKEKSTKHHNSEPMHSDWSEWPDMPWVGPRLWGNRLHPGLAVVREQVRCKCRT
jgi:hypothetical protein